MTTLRAAALALLAALLAALPAQGSPLSDGDRQCLGCHGQKGLTKTFGKGETLELLVSAEAFAGSAHAPVGCASCHAGIDPKKHPGSPAQYDTKRAFSVAASEACRACHEPIVEAQARSVHGKARDRQTGIPAPVCADCHRPHAVTVTAAATARSDTCLSCHADAAASHGKWLPNTKRHLETVACAACHSPMAKRKVDLRLYDAGGKREMTGGEVAGKDIGAGGPLDEKRLWDVVRGGAAGDKVTVVGRLEVSTGPEAHALADSTMALKDCTTCHRKGAEAFQNVTLSIIGPDGKRVRYETQKEVLQSPTSVDSVSGFYAIGGTRITLLDVLVALALAGGILAPLGHLLLRKIMRRKGKGNA